MKHRPGNRIHALSTSRAECISPGNRGIFTGGMAGTMGHALLTLNFSSHMKSSLCLESPFEAYPSDYRVKLLTHVQFLIPEMHTYAQEKHSMVQAQYMIFSANSVVKSNQISSRKKSTHHSSERSNPTFQTSTFTAEIQLKKASFPSSPIFSQE